MAFFRLGRESAMHVRGEGVYLRPTEPRDYDAWSSLRENSRAFLAPWEPIWPADDLTKLSFRRRVKRHSEEISKDESYPLLIFRMRDDSLVGGLTIGQVRRGVAQTATIGYWMGAAYAGQGYMSRALRASAAFAFSALRLHRLEAACLPVNSASIHLLESVGFRREGLARAYLCINGRWQDHFLYAMLETDASPPRIRRTRLMKSGAA